MKWLIPLLFIATPVFAQEQPRCAPREIVLERLNDMFSESRRSIMVTGGQIVEIFANLESGSWSLIMTRPDGITCMIGAGNSYEETDDDLQPTGMRL